MHFRSLSISVAAGLLAWGFYTVPVLAQELPALGTIVVRQNTPTEAIADMTMIYPSQMTTFHTTKEFVISDAVDGRYTLLIDAPSGMTTRISVKRGDEEIQTTTIPQVTFVLLPGDSVSIDIQYYLAFHGVVGVVSEPSGIPFKLEGPNGIAISARTPVSYDKMPIGRYGVTFLPEGCPKPPPKGDVLKDKGRISFSIAIQCSTLQVGGAVSSAGSSVSRAAFVPRSSSTSSASPATVTTASSAAPIILPVAIEAPRYASGFRDVPDGEWFAPFVVRMNQAGLLTGYKDAAGNPTGLFGPENPVTLAELAAIAHRMANIAEPDASLVPTNAIARNQWFSRYIASAEKLNWWMYSGNNTYTDVRRAATRAEVIVTLLQALHISIEWEQGGLFSDVTTVTPYAAAIETAFKRGFVTGIPNADGSVRFEPLSNINRAALSAVLGRILDERKKM